MSHEGSVLITRPRKSVDMDEPARYYREIRQKANYHRKLRWDQIDRCQRNRTRKIMRNDETWEPYWAANKERLLKC